MLLYLSLLGLLLSLLLLYFNVKRFKSSIYLGLFLLLVSLYGLNHYIFVYEKSVFWISILYVHTTFLAYLTGPMAYFYVRSLIRDDARLSKKDLPHFLPALIHLLGSLSYIFKPFSYKTEVAGAIANDINFLYIHKGNLITEWMGSNDAMYLSRPVLALCYTIASIIIWRRHQSQKKKSPLLAQRRVIDRWIACFLGFQLLLFLSFASALLNSNRPEVFSYLLDPVVMLTVVAGSLLALILTPFFFPQVLYGLPDLSTDLARLKQQETSYKPTPAGALSQDTFIASNTQNKPPKQNTPENTNIEVAPASIELEQANIEAHLPNVPESSVEYPGTELPDNNKTLLRKELTDTATAPQTADTGISAPELPEVDPEPLPASKMQLEEDYAAALSQEVDLYMENNQPFLIPDFNMLKLAHNLNVPAHHLSYLFREHKQISFNDYRNTYRVTYAQSLINAGLSNELTLEAIGLKSGFASRSTFFKSFKKVTGLSPSEYIPKPRQ